MTNHSGTIGELTKPEDPRKRMGVYGRLEEVPGHHRLYQFASSYRDRDAWAEFTAAKTADNPSDSAEELLDRTGRRWKRHMAEQKTHHALATPDEVESYFAGLLDALAPGTVYYPYWVNLSQFYDWMLWHTEHPHVYNPVLMAAAEKTATKRVWEYVIENVR